MQNSPNLPLPPLFMKHLPLLLLVLALSACAQTAQETSTPTNDQVQVEWQTVQTGTGAYEEPLMQLSLVNPVEGTIHFRTECSGTVSPEGIEGTNDLAVLCWWAGGGERFTVAKSGSTLTIRSQQVDEESGYGEWVDVETVEL